MLNIAIVEDENEAAELLQKALNKYAAETGMAVKCTVFAYGEAFLNNYKPIYDIVFMDIMLSGMTGMETAHKLREHDGAVPLIFLTSMAQFAIEGYSVNAVDYIIKPFKYYDLKLRMDRVCRKLIQNEKSIFVTSSGGGRKLRVQDIYYIETNGHQLIYHTAEGVFSSYSKTMKDIEKELAVDGFARCSVSCLVNMHLISALYGNELVVGNETVQITRGKRKEFLTTLDKFSKGGK